MNNIHHPALASPRSSNTPPRRAQTDGPDLSRSSNAPVQQSTVSRRLHRHRQTVSHGTADVQRSRKHHVYSRSHGHHHIADGLRSTMPEQYQQLAVEEERREREHTQRLGLQREGTATRTQHGPNDIPEEQLVQRPQPVITMEDIAKERWKQKARDEELLSTLHHLSEHSLTTTRRLDDTYYSILERVGHLRSTTRSLQELSNLAKGLCRNFEDESKEISNDAVNQTRHLNNFDDQRAKIGELEQRISSGQERAVKLDERLAKARERVIWVEQRDAEEVKRTARFYRGLWSTLGIIGGILLLLFVIHHLRGPHQHLLGGTGMLDNLPYASNKSLGRLPPAVEEMLAEIRRDKEKVAGPDVLSDRWKGDEKAEKRLRVFDEL